MREMKNSGVAWIGDIPSEWNICKLKDIYTESIAGEVIDKGYWHQGNELLYTCQKTPMFSNYIGFPDRKRTKKSDLLLTRNATPYIFIPEENSIYSNVVQKITLKSNVNKRFVKYVLKQGVDALVVNGDTIPSYNMSVWSNIYITLPPLIIQDKIAEVIDRRVEKIDTLIINQEAQIEKLKQYKQLLITEVVTKGLKPDVEMKDSGIENVGKIPSHWSVVSLKFLMYIRARLGWKGLRAEEYVDSGYTFIGTPNLDDNGNIDWDNVYYITKERYDESPEIKLSQGDVLLTKDGAGIGKCAYIHKLPCEATTNGSLAVITCKEKLEGKYLYYYFKSYYFQKLIDQIKNGMGVPHLFQSDMKNIIMPLPFIIEQKEAIEFLDIKIKKINKLIEIKQSKIAKLNEYKKSLIYEYVTGKKEVV